MMAFESGIDKEDLERAMLPRMSPKVIYVDGWVYVPNWMKYHLSSSGTISPQHQKGFDAAWKNVPERIREKIKEIEQDGYPMVGVSPSSSTLSSSYQGAIAPGEKEFKIDGDEKPKRGFKPAKYPHSKEVFSWFPKPQKSWAIDTTQLKHAELLFERGEEKVRKALRFIEEHQDEEYFPSITKPSDLERKWVDLAKYAKRNS